MDDDLIKRMQEADSVIDFGIQALWSVEHDRCIYDEETAEIVAQVEALDKLKQTIAEAAAEIQHLRQQQADHGR
jgi:cell division protein FtsB